ncbi:MAG: hypothetical protein EOM90_11980 [Alphaproteobacteria bacterium]|nr:hypothetical protein [Alphaproteobacteria bacterium]
MKTLQRSAILLMLAVVFLQGCKKDETVYEPAGNNMASLKHRYNLAVIDAKTVQPYEIFHSLVPVVNYGDSMAGQGNLVWSTDSAGRQRVLVISWMRQGNLQYWPEGKTFKTSNVQAYMSWVTTSPEMLDFLKKQNLADSAALHLRIAQVLGMPPDTKNDYFVEFWVYPEDLFRPTPDPEITDQEAELYFPATASEKHRKWFLNEMTAKYDTNTTSAFPWTRLGYTYDWANPSYPVGLSEFVVDTSSVVTVKKAYSSAQYYQMSLTMKK